jgi:hypothetical protein
MIGGRIFCLTEFDSKCALVSIPICASNTVTRLPTSWDKTLNNGRITGDLHEYITPLETTPRRFNLGGLWT